MRKRNSHIRARYPLIGLPWRCCRSQRRDAKGGMSYEDYLQVLLLSKSKAVKLTRGMDMIEVEIRSTKGKKGFRLDCCIEAAEISVDVEAHRKQTFSVTRQYSYI